jgi:hypothetical protein
MFLLPSVPPELEAAAQAAATKPFKSRADGTHAWFDMKTKGEATTLSRSINALGYQVEECNRRVLVTLARRPTPLTHERINVLAALLLSSPPSGVTHEEIETLCSMARGSV